MLATGIPPNAPGLDGVGYREVVAMIEGRLPQAQLRDAVLVSTRRYAKRQETWLRNQLRDRSAVSGQQSSVWLLDATPPPDVLAGEIVKRLSHLAGDRQPATDHA